MACDASWADLALTAQIDDEAAGRPDRAQMAARATGTGIVGSSRDDDQRPRTTMAATMARNSADSGLVISHMLIPRGAAGRVSHLRGRDRAAARFAKFGESRHNAQAIPR